MEAVWILLLLGLSLSVSFLLSGMEAGALAVNRLRVRHLARRGDKAARLLAGYLNNPEQFLWVILVGNVLSNFLFLGVTLYWVHNWLGGRPWLWGIAALALVFALYTWGDLLPKMLFRSMPTRACLLAVRAYRLLDFLLAPLVRPLAWATDKAARLLGGRRYDGRLFGNREELLAVMRESARSLPREEQALIDKVLGLQTRTVGGLTRPMTEVQTLPEEAPLAELFRLYREKGRSRIPVRDQAKGRTAGVAALKSIVYEENLDLSRPVREFMTPPLFLPETLDLERAFLRLQKAKPHIAIVIDKDRREIGILTLEDILEHIFGDMPL